MSQYGAIVRKAADKDIPDAYLDKLLANNNYCGIAIVDDEGMQLDKASGGDLTREYLQETLAEFKDRNVTLCFGRSETATDLDDISPFIMVGTSDEPDFVACVVGNYPGYDKEKSVHPNTFFFAHEFLKPEMESLFELSDGDGEKLMKALEKPIQKKKMLKDCVGVGAITILAANDGAVTWSQSDNAAEFEWGWTSETYGYPNVESSDKEEGTPKRKTFPNRGASRSTVREPAPSSATTPAAATAKAASADTKVTTAKKYDVRSEKPPLTLSRKDRKGWYKVRIGYYPRGGDSSCAINVYYDTETKRTLTISQVKDLGLKATGLPALNNPDRDPGKDTEPEYVEGQPQEQPATTPATTKVDGTMLPVISPNSRQFYDKLRQTEKARKVIAETGEAVKNPQFLKEMEAKIAPFWKQLGYDTADAFVDSLPKTTEYLFEIARTKPDIAMCMMFAWMCEQLGKRYKKEQKLSTQEEQELAAEELKPAAKTGRKTFPKRARG